LFDEPRHPWLRIIDLRVKELMNKELEINFTDIDELPISYCMPAKENNNRSLALWIPYLGGDRETCIKELKYLSSKGFLSVSLDPYLHGKRNTVKKPGIRTRVFNDFRAHMWNILGITTLDCMRIIDWATKEFNLNNTVVAGGLSMGGDIAVSLAGADERIKKISTVASSPDWLRPGMTDVMDSSKAIDQGKSTAYGAWLYSKLDPISNVNNFTPEQEMLFMLGERDTHINPSYAKKFYELMIQKEDMMRAKIKINIVEGANHISLLQRKTILREALEFLVE